MEAVRWRAVLSEHALAKNFRDVKVWDRAHQLALRIYQVTRSFPKEELVGLTGQMRRAGASIPANLVEALAGAGEVDQPRLIDAAQASASALEYYLLLARDLEYIDRATYDELAIHVVEVKKLLASFRTGIRGMAR
jgi:four helix bundle protein